MIIKLEVDLNDFYAENFETDSDLGVSPTESISGEVVSIIKNEVRNAIRNQVSDDVKRIASEAYNEFGEAKTTEIAESAFDEFLKDGLVKKDRYSDEMVPVKEKLRGIFDSSNSWKDPEDIFKKVGEDFADECRKRYDLLYASNIVTGLEKQGLLKAGVFESLTNDTDN